MKGIVPRVVCEGCGRSIARTATGSPRSHRINGQPCPGSGNESGTCTVCGRVTPLELDGTVRPHKQLRVRRGVMRSPDGIVTVGPETYSSTRDCPGAGEAPEPVDGAVDIAPMPVEPMSAERWPSARELAAERFGLPKDVPHNGAGEPGRGVSATPRTNHEKEIT